MAGTFIEVATESAALLKGLKELAARAAHIEPALQDIGEWLLQSTDERWQRGVDPSGQPWEPLAESTRRQKKKNHDRILIEYGLLRSSIAYQIGLDELLVGTNLVYGAIHQFGGEIEHAAQSRLVGFRVDKESGRSRFASPKQANFEQWTTRDANRTTMPARPFLGIDQEDEERIAKIIEEHIFGAF